MFKVVSIATEKVNPDQFNFEEMTNTPNESIGCCTNEILGFDPHANDEDWCEDMGFGKGTTVNEFFSDLI